MCSGGRAGSQGAANELDDAGTRRPTLCMRHYGLLGGRITRWAIPIFTGYKLPSSKRPLAPVALICCTNGTTNA